MTFSTQQGPALLRMGLETVYGLYGQRPKVLEQYFNKRKSNKAAERYAQMQYLPIAQIKQQGQAAFIADMNQAYEPVIPNITIGITTIFTAESIQDNLYKDAFPNVAKASYTSILSATEQIGANVFNNGFTQNIYDGAPFFSEDHPLGGGAYGFLANTNTGSVGLSEETLAAAVTTIKYTFRDQAGNLISPGIKGLMVSQDLAPVAKKLVASSYEPGSPNNAVNYNYSEFGQKYIVNPYLNPNTWIVLTDVDGAIYQDRMPIMPYVFEDPNTRNVICNSVSRIGLGIIDFMCAYGCKAS